MVETGRRAYRSPTREARARATRRAIVAAASELFVERGYAGTTIDLVATRARVSRKTVFTAVGGKAALLKLAWDWAIVGDDEPVPMAERAAVRDLQAQTDPDRLLELWAGFAAEVSARLAPLHAVLRAAADVDEEAAAVLATTDGERRAGAHGIVGGLVRLGALRPGLPVERAADLAALLMDPASYAELVGRRAWSHAEYVEWLARAARASFLEG